MVKAAVVTGGHSYDVVGFHRLFRDLEGVDAYIQHLDDYASSAPEARDWYDAVVFYIMPTEGPTDEGQPWYAGEPKRALEHLGITDQGVVVLHHALLAYPQWPAWSDMVGVKKRKFDYHIGERVTCHIARPDHPITNGIGDWEMVDELYEMDEAGEGSDILITCDNPKSMPTLAWTRTHGRARVFCYESGHDNRTWENETFRTVLSRGTQWAAGRL